MKKVLLTTTALVMTAGVASAEITFSGKGEAGVYRTAPTAAVAGVAGSHAASSTTAGHDVWAFDSTTGLLTQTKVTTNDGATSAADIQLAANELAAKTAALAAAQRTYDEEAASAHARANDFDALNLAKANLAVAQAIYDQIAGTTAVGKGATPKLKAYSGYDFNVALSGASDNGMTFAMGFDMGAGHIADQDDDRAMDAQGGAVANDELTITYAGYTVGIGDDLIDDLYDDSQNGDVSIAGSLGDLTFKLVTDMDDDVKAVAASKYYKAESGAADGTSAAGVVTDGGAAYTTSVFTDTAAVAAVYNPTSYSIGYTMGNIAFSMAGTEHDDRGHAAAKMSLNYTVSDALSVKLESDNVGTYKDIAKVSVTSKISDALSITASVKDDKDHALNTNTGGKQSQDVSISYSAGALSSTLATDEGSNWWVNAQYDLGGGAQAFTTFDHTEFLVAGVNFKF